MRQDSQPAFVEVEVSDVGRPPLLQSVDTADIIVRHPSGMAVELRGTAAERVAAHVLARLDGWS